MEGMQAVTMERRSQREVQMAGVMVWRGREDAGVEGEYSGERVVREMRVGIMVLWIRGEVSGGFEFVEWEMDGRVAVEKGWAIRDGWGERESV
jgi:hypothetical protein